MAATSMNSVTLPISKSIANRLLLLQAIHGDPLMRVSADSADDVCVLHDALERLREHQHGEPLTLHLKNCGTALRFLQVHIERCYPGEPITLTGDARLMERIGAPTSQTTSARILHGDDVPYSVDESPYITMTRRIVQSFSELRERSLLSQHSGLSGVAGLLERDWSAAAFWYEYAAIHGGELLLEGLTADSLQGDRIVADVYAEQFGVHTTFTPEGAHLSAPAVFQRSGLCSFSAAVCIDFEKCPDLYPAIALTCERLGITLHATGTDRLCYKESNRLAAVALHQTRHDHRMAMALLVAGYDVDDTDCIAKSYPSFMQQWAALNGSDAHARAI